MIIINQIAYLNLFSVHVDSAWFGVECDSAFIQ